MVDLSFLSGARARASAAIRARWDCLCLLCVL